ncbi:uncharacterized protein LOC129573547 [Sitodiplosis mosellana]|uniref:uncharacterized protein LOC129573547 n=1 Tax=Sitodiplosis mosellana TaxID=263140 RepID=UPI0024451F03|nr:uncharacterized protein LOC129573547 [Sitodiplosis mosellana]
MGVRGLKTFLEREQQTRPINIGNEVDKWKRANPGKTPIIVIDFLSLTNGLTKKEEDAICGGRHQIALENWKKMLNALKSTGSSLVFFSDLNIQVGKVDEWLNRRNEEFLIYTEIYDLIDSGISLREVIERQSDKKSVSSTFYGMAVIAREYGQFNYSIRRECDLEIANYAKNNNALAVITNDTDFLIFDGNWRLWSPQDIHITQSNRLKTIEYNRNGIANTCSLARHQLPLFATLLANDFTHGYYNQLARFYCSMGPMKYRIRNVARYVRKLGNVNLNEFDISRIIQQVFGYTNDELQQLFRQSLDSYNIDFSPMQIDNPLEQKLLNTAMYRPYMANSCGIHGFTMGFYDMRGSSANLPILLIDWVKRRKGILKRNTNETFLVLAKKNMNQSFVSHTETVICPEFPLPSLEELYVGTDDDSKIIDIKWKLLAWIMSLSEDVISLIKNLPKDYVLISTILFALVKGELIGTEEADGILYTESMVYANATSNVEYPIAVVSKNVRAAHLYNITFGSIRQNFSIAGLLPYIQEVLQFDGVYYQKLMEKISSMNTAEREILFNPIRKYRIYANIS